MRKTREPFTLYVGVMYAGKTQRMLHDIRAAEAIGKKVLLVKPDIDDRFGKDVVQSRGDVLPHHAISMPVEHPEEILRTVFTPRHRRHFEYVGIDEPQFFNQELRDVILTLTENGVEVVGAGLPMDFRGNAFPTMEKIEPLAHIVSLQARCMHPRRPGSHKLCGENAVYTQRLINGLPAAYDSPTIMIDKPDVSTVEYKAMCHRHWQIDLPKRRFY